MNLAFRVSPVPYVYAGALSPAEAPGDPRLFLIPLVELGGGVDIRYTLYIEWWIWICRSMTKPSRAMALVQSAAEAVAAFHALPCVHRDIKPDNFLIHPVSGRALVHAQRDPGECRIAELQGVPKVQPQARR